MHAASLSVRLTAVALLLAPVALGCGQAPAKPAPAAAEKPRAEGDLARTTLSAKAADSLGIVSQALKPRPEQERLPLTGWIMPRPGNEFVVTAPVAGYVQTPGNARQLPVPGMTVAGGQEVLTMEPVLSPLEQVQMKTLAAAVENDLAKARTSVALAEVELKRAAGLRKEGVQGQQLLEQAKARYDHAVQDRRTAEEKQKLFATSKVTLRAPRAGTVLTVHVSPGQYVPVAAPLLTVADLSELWVRVPVPEADLPLLPDHDKVTVTLKTNGNNGPRASRPLEFQGRLKARVPQVDPVRHTADLLYALEPPAKPIPLAKDQMVTVFVPLGSMQEVSVVPYSAVVYDVYGGTWVYLDKTTDKAKGHVYERRRVELGSSVPGGVVVRPALPAGDRIVVAGVGELFSREFYRPPVAGAP
jgi:cobalt-zinc-cadmium efflux system membrane fusion protein